MNTIQSGDTVNGWTFVKRWANPYGENFVRCIVQGRYEFVHKDGAKVFVMVYEPDMSPESIDFDERIQNAATSLNPNPPRSIYYKPAGDVIEVSEEPSGSSSK